MFETFSSGQGRRAAQGSPCKASLTQPWRSWRWTEARRTFSQALSTLTKVCVICWCGALSGYAQLEALHPSNFEGLPQPMRFEGGCTAFAPDSEGGQYWLCPTARGGHAIHWAPPKGESARLGTLEVRSGLLLADAFRDRTWLIDNGQRPARIYELAPGVPPIYRTSWPGVLPTAAAIDANGALWVAGQEIEGPALYRAEGLGSREIRDLKIERQARLLLLPSRLVALPTGEVLYADKTSVWRLDPKRGQSLQVYIAPSPPGAGTSEIRGLVANPFEAVGAGYFIFTAMLDETGATSRVTAHFGTAEGGTPVICSERVLSGADGDGMDLRRFASHRNSGLFIAAVGAGGVRFDRIRQRAEFDLPGTFTLTDEGQSLNLRLVARQGSERRVMLLASRDRILGGQWRDRGVPATPGAPGVRVLRDGFHQFAGVPSLMTPANGRLDLRLPRPSGWSASVPFWIHAYVEDPVAINGRFLIASVLVPPRAGGGEVDPGLLGRVPSENR